MPETSQPARDKTRLLASYPLFRDLGEPTLERLAARLVVKSLPRHTVLFVKGDAANVLIGVVEGAVKISAPGPDGHEIIFNIMHPGEMFGEIAALDGGARSADAMTMTPSVLCYLDRRDVIAAIRAEPDLALRVVQLCCERIRRVSERVEEVAFLTTPARLAKALLRLADNATGAGASAPVTQQQLSQLVGLSREATNKQLREWEKVDFVRLERGLVVLRDRPALTAIAER